MMDDVEIYLDSLGSSASLIKLTDEKCITVDNTLTEGCRCRRIAATNTR